MTHDISLKVIIKALLDDSKAFKPRYLRFFSDLGPDDLDILAKAWPLVSTRRKHGFLEDLEELAETDTLVCFDGLARSLLHDPDAKVRVLALRLLWDSNDTKLVPTFLDILNNDVDASARGAAASALAQYIYLGELEEISARVSQDVADNLIAATTATNESLVRRRSLEALGSSSRPEVPLLIEAAFAEKDPEWKISALFAMGRSCESSWGKHVIPQLRNHNEDIRVEAIQAAGELGLQTARPVMLDQLEDEEDFLTRRAIIWALSKIGGEGVRDRLDELMESEADDEEAEFLEDALANLDFTEDNPFFNLLDVEADEDQDS